MTQSAVSRHVKNLETYLKKPLFQRLTRKVQLTSFGRNYLNSISAGLDEIESATGVRAGAKVDAQGQHHADYCESVAVAATLVIH